jgi:glyoxylase-like metal-dependent hydrolase (beta-lactamase superfamily II)
MRAFGVHGTSEEGQVFDFAPDVVRVAMGIANTYLVGHATRWVLVDTGPPGLSALIRRAARKRFGAGARPAAIILTHGHVDHAGNVDVLAREWNAPVYAHALELQYLAGRSEYPPHDPTVGGAMALLSRLFPRGGQRAVTTPVLPLSNTIPALPEWEWVHTPGHTPGHLSLWRPADRLLLAGDAIATMNTDSWVEQARRTPELSKPPAALTPDWEAARQSVEALAALAPMAIGAGHGKPVAGRMVADAVGALAMTFAPPAHGRYVSAPASIGPVGVEWVPPPVPDPLPLQAASAALVVLGGVGLAKAGDRVASALRRSKESGSVLDVSTR